MVSRKDIAKFLQTLKSDIKSGEVSFTEIRSDGEVETYISAYKGRCIGLRTDGKLFLGPVSADGRVSGRPPHKKVPYTEEDTVRDLIDLIRRKRFSSMYEDYVKKVINDG